MNKKIITENDINKYLRNKNNRFSSTNFTGVEGCKYGVIDKKINKIFCYKNINTRNNVFKKILKKELKK